MNLDKLDSINIEMHNGKEYFGVKVIQELTKLDTPTLVFEYDNCMTVVNWSDVKIAYFYEGED
jgi:hypothetical protein